MKSTTWAAAGLVGACAICCAPLIIGGVTAAAVGLSVGAGLTLLQIAGLAVGVLALSVVGVLALRRRKADCACKTSCSIESCEKQ